jgi:hypothetical protein
VVILAEVLECGMHPSNGRDQSVELEQACACMNRIGGECATEAEQLLR